MGRQINCRGKRFSSYYLWFNFPSCCQLFSNYIFLSVYMKQSKQLLVNYNKCCLNKCWKLIHNFFKQTVKMPKSCGRTVEIKWRCREQVNRKNYEGDSETFHKSSVFISCSDNLVFQLQSRFNELNTSTICGLHLLTRTL